MPKLHKPNYDCFSKALIFKGKNTILGMVCIALVVVYVIRYTYNMKTTSTTELRANLSAMMDQVNDDHEPVIVTRAKGRPAVIMSLEDYRSIEETDYLLRSPKNAQRLLTAIESLRAGDGVERDLLE
jgi:antitoxin YefM